MNIATNVDHAAIAQAGGITRKIKALLGLVRCGTEGQKEYAAAALRTSR